MADAMIMHRLFVDGIFAHGGTVVATSNCHPVDLYARGINRSRFIPFIDAVMEPCPVFTLPSSKRDYRLLSPPDEDEAHRKVTPPSFVDLAKRTPPEWISIPISPTRSMRVLAVRPPHAPRHFVTASFRDLCEAARGSADFRALCMVSCLGPHPLYALLTAVGV